METYTLYMKGQLRSVQAFTLVDAVRKMVEQCEDSLMSTEEYTIAKLLGDISHEYTLN